MNIQKSSIFIAVAVVLVVAVVAISNRSSSVSTPPLVPNASNEITVSGESECLPHKNTEGPTTMECALGIKANDGRHYALNDPEAKYIQAIETGKKVTITGKFTESTDSRYDIVGTIEITTVNTGVEVPDSWKTYSNISYKFSFRYPPTWRFVANPNIEKGVGTIQLFNYSANKYVGGEQLESGDVKIEMVLLDNSDGADLRLFVQRQTAQGLSGTSEHIHEAAKLNNINAIVDRVKDDTSYKSYYAKLDDTNVLVVTVSPQVASPDVDGIISSINLSN